MTYLKEDQKLLLPGLPSCLSYLSVYISLASPLTAPTHEPAFQALSILPLYCHHCFCLHPFHSSALTFFLLSSNFIISGMVLQYYHLSAFILVLSNSFCSCYFSDLSEIRNSATSLFSLTFNGFFQCYAKSCHTPQQFYS